MKSGGSNNLTYSSIPRLGNVSALYPSKAARPSEIRKKATAGGRTKEKTGSLFYTVICTGQIFLKLHFSSSNVFWEVQAQRVDGAGRMGGRHSGLSPEGRILV